MIISYIAYKNKRKNKRRKKQQKIHKFLLDNMVSAQNA